MHKLLKRQIEKHLVGVDIGPEFSAFISAIDEAYSEADKDKQLVDHSLEVSSEEFVDLNERLRNELERQKREDDLRKQRISRAKMQQDAIALLSTQKSQQHDSFEKSAKDIVKIAAQAVGVNFVGVWRYDKSGKILENVTSYDRGRGRLTKSAPLKLGSYPQYLKALMTGSPLNADDARSDPRTQGFAVGYSVPNNVTSMLDTAVVVGGKIRGLLRMEHTGPMRHWHTDEITFAKIISDQIAEALLDEERKDSEAKLQESEEKFHDLFENISDMIFAVGRDGKILYANKKMKKLLGYPEADIRRMSCTDLVLKDLRASFKGTLKSVMRGKSFENMETTFVTKDGREIQVNGHISPYFKDGQFVSTRSIFRDMTERKKAERALENAHRRLNAIIESLPEATFVIGKDRRVIAWNKAMEDMTGVMKQEMIGKGNYEYAIPFYGKRRPILLDLALDPKKNMTKNMVKLYSHIKKEGHTLHAEVFVPRVLKGKGAYLNASASPLFDLSGEVSGAIESILDITEKKKAEEAVRENEGYLKDLLDSIHAGIFVIDPVAHRIIEANTFALNMIGAKKEKVIGQVCHGVICPAEEGKCPITDLKQQIDCSERVLLDSKKRSIPIIKSVVPIRRGGKEALLESFFDISDRKKAEEAQRQLAEVVKYSTELINLASIDGKMIFLNDAGGRMLGIDPGSVSGVKIMEVIPKHLVKQVKRDLLPALLAGKSWEGELQYKNLRTGAITDVQAMTFAILDQKTHSPMLLANVSRDITEQKKAAGALLQRSRDLEALNTKLSEKNEDLEKFKRLTVDRELRMEDLRKENELLKSKLGGTIENETHETEKSGTPRRQ